MKQAKEKLRIRVGFNLPEPRSDVVEMGPRPPPEEAPSETEADGDASDGNTTLPDIAGDES